MPAVDIGRRPPEMSPSSPEAERGRVRARVSPGSACVAGIGGVTSLNRCGPSYLWSSGSSRSSSRRRRAAVAGRASLSGPAGAARPRGRRPGRRRRAGRRVRVRRPGACPAAGLRLGGGDCGPTGDGCGGRSSAGPARRPRPAAAAARPAPAAASVACVPRTCAAAGANCGPVADGCGGLFRAARARRPHLRRRRHAERLRRGAGRRHLHQPVLAAGGLRRGRHHHGERHRVRAQRRRPALQRAGLRAQRAGRGLRAGSLVRPVRRAGLGLAARQRRHGGGRHLPAPERARRARASRW